MQIGSFAWDHPLFVISYAMARGLLPGEQGCKRFLAFVGCLLVLFNPAAVPLIAAGYFLGPA